MRFKLLTAMILLATARPVLAADDKVIDATVEVWPEGKMPGRGATAPEMVKPSTDTAIRITNVSQPTLTVYRAPPGAKPTPAMIICPGGGYSYVVMNKEGSEIATWLN